MKSKTPFRLIALLLAMTPLGALAQTTFFTDTFVNGSTTNGPSIPGGTPTASFTSYDIAAVKNATASTIAPGDFTLKLNASTASGWMESQALFTTNPVTLSTVGDYIDISVVFTNTPQTNVNSANVPVSSLLVGTTAPIYVGLYNSGGNQPVAGGLANAGLGGTATFTSGNCANWQGYVSQITSNGTSRISTRPLQVSATTSAAQDLAVGSGNTGGYSGPAGTVIATTPAAPVPLVSGGQYTLYLKITYIAVNTLSFSNSIYSGSGLGGPIIYYQTNAIATNATFLTASFDGFSICAFNKSPSGGPAINPTMDITSITITGQSSLDTNPPVIVTQPVPVVVATNGTCPFQIVASGNNLTYQWHRNGTNLLNGGNISGATSATLIISPADAADLAVPGDNGYYVTVSRLTSIGILSTNSQTITNSLTLVPATNLIWTAAGGATWDLNNTISWEDVNLTAAAFNYGDSVRFDDTASSKFVTLTGSYLSASSVTVDSESGATYSFTGTGSIAGSGNLIYTGTGQLTLNTANTYSGGTLVSNTTTPASLYVYLENYNGLGTGPVTLDNAGGTMETTTTGGAALGINGDINVLDDFKIQVDGVGTYATVFLGNLSGTINKTLTINPETTGTTNRFRVYGTNTVFNANLILDNVDSATSQALYNGTVLAPYEPSGSQTYNGVISGVGGIVQRGNGTTVLNNGLNTYSGGTFITAGAIAFGVDSTPTNGTVISGPIGRAPLFIAPEAGTASGGGGSGTVLAANGARIIANPLQYPSATNNQVLIIGGTNSLTFTGPYALNGQDGTTPATNRTLQVNNTGPTTISGVISDGGLGFGLIKTGTNALYLNNPANNYAGPTIVSAGLLAGSGNVAGSVVVTNNGSIGGGAATDIGTFAIGGNLTLTNGNGFFRVNRAGSSNDLVSVSGGLTNSGTGTITVTNLGATLQLNDTFFLFNKAMSNGAALTVIGGGVAWSNNLAANGSIVVASPPDTGVQLTAPASVLLAANITNTLTVTNAGPGIALGMVVTDTLPANVKFVSATGGGTTNANAGQVVWSGFSLAVNTATNFTLIVNATAAGNATNTATVVNSAADPNPGNNTATSVTAVTTVIVPTVSPYIASFSLVGGNLVINGTNGVNGGTYYLLESTNVVKPFSQWTAVATNIVSTNGASGAFTFTGTNVVNPGAGHQFYILSSTNNY